MSGITKGVDSTKSNYTQPASQPSSSSQSSSSSSVTIRPPARGPKVQFVADTDKQHQSDATDRKLGSFVAVPRFQSVPDQTSHHLESKKRISSTTTSSDRKISDVMINSLPIKENRTSENIPLDAAHVLLAPIAPSNSSHVKFELDLFIKDPKKVFFFDKTDEGLVFDKHAGTIKDGKDFKQKINEKIMAYLHENNDLMFVNHDGDLANTKLIFKDGDLPEGVNVDDLQLSHMTDEQANDFMAAAAHHLNYLYSQQKQDVNDNHIDIERNIKASEIKSQTIKAEVQKKEIKTDVEKSVHRLLTPSGLDPVRFAEKKARKQEAAKIEAEAIADDELKKNIVKSAELKRTKMKKVINDQQVKE